MSKMEIRRPKESGEKLHLTERHPAGARAVFKDRIKPDELPKIRRVDKGEKGRPARNTSKTTFRLAGMFQDSHSPVDDFLLG